MLKTYTTSTTTPKDKTSSPKQAVLDSILNYSKSLEIISVKGMKETEKQTKIELTLN